MVLHELSNQSLTLTVWSILSLCYESLQINSDPQSLVVIQITLNMESTCKAYGYYWMVICWNLDWISNPSCSGFTFVSRDVQHGICLNSTPRLMISWWKIAFYAWHAKKNSFVIPDENNVFDHCEWIWRKTQDDYGSGLSKAYLVLEAKTQNKTWRRRDKQYALKLMNQEEQ